MSALINTLLRLYGGSLHRRLRQSAKTLAAAQKSLLLSILRNNSATAFGREHEFARIKSEGDFRCALAIRDYEGFRPYVERLLEGENQVLTQEEVVRFNLTSGTTGRPKLIPFTHAGLRQEMQLISQWYYLALQSHPGFLDHHHLAIVGALIEGNTAAGIPYGSASGAIYRQMPWILRRQYVVPERVFSYPDYEQRYFLIARCALSRRLSFMLTPNPSTVLRLAEVIKERKQDLVRAIWDGSWGIAEQAARSNKLPSTLRPAAARARFLEKVLAKDDCPQLSAVWPELKLVGCWLGGSVGQTAAKLRAYFEGVRIRDIGYMASEAHMTLPMEDESAAGMLAFDSNYYEFIPEEEHGEENPTVLSAGELQTGKRYAVVITTVNGLYRYDINDIVEVKGWCAEAPLVAFVCKGQDMSSITGEKMHPNHIISALTTSCQKFALNLQHFRAIADSEAARYIICVEMTSMEDEAKIGQEIISFIDSILADENVEYAAKRKSGRLNMPVVWLMQLGWAEEERREFEKMRSSDVQFKWRVLKPEVNIFDAKFCQKVIEVGL